MNKWRQIWAKRNATYEDITIDTLIRADGFESGAGKIEEKDWLRYAKFISGKMDVSKDDSIFEIGCGCGAFLYTFYKAGHRVGGVDYSSSLIRMAKNVMKDMNFTIGEAQHLQTKDKYDIVISNSVFHYFPDLDYADKVIRKMLDKSIKAIAILDVPDSELEAESERERGNALSVAEYKKKYEGLSHLYYKREWFFDLLKHDHYHIEIFDQNIKYYGNNKFRFNVVIKR